MYGEIAWMNSLTIQYFGGWEIFPTVKGCPCIRPITEKESVIHLKLPENVSKNDIPVQKIETFVQKNKNNPPKQGLLFEF